MDDVSKSFIINQARKAFKYPADVTDDEVMAIAHQNHFNEMSKWTSDAQDAEDNEGHDAWAAQNPVTNAIDTAAGGVKKAEGAIAGAVQPAVQAVSRADKNLGGALSNSLPGRALKGLGILSSGFNKATDAVGDAVAGPPSQFLAQHGYPGAAEAAGWAGAALGAATPAIASAALGEGLGAAGEALGGSEAVAGEAFPGELQAMKDLKAKYESFPLASGEKAAAEKAGLPTSENRLSNGPITPNLQSANDEMAGKEVPAWTGKSGENVPGSGVGKVGSTPADEFRQYLDKRISDLSPAKERTRVVQPGPMEKLAGNAWSATSAIKPSYASAIVADPSIMDTAVTPNVAAVSKEYSDVFGRLGMSIDSNNLKRVLGKGYFPNEGQVSQHLQNITDQTDALSGMKPGEQSDPSALFMARSEAAAVKRSSQYAMNPSLKRYVDNAQETLDTALENSGVPEIKDLSAKFFRAKAQEAGGQILPQNKNMSPNVLRSLLMAKNVGQGAAGLALGPDRLAGAGQLAAGLAMSPAVGSGVLSALSGDASGAAGSMIPSSAGPLSSLNKKKDEK